MDKHQEFGPQLLWDVLANRSSTPLDNLLRWVTGTMVGLVAWALFVHSPAPLVPAAALLWGLRTYHRQTHSHAASAGQQGSEAERCEQAARGLADPSQLTG